MVDGGRTAIGEFLAISFAVRPRVDLGGALEVLAVVDGREFTALIDEYESARAMEPSGSVYGGLIPSFFRFGPLDAHFLAEETGPRTDGRIPVLGCECGEWGCWPLMTKVTVAADAVTWSRFEQPFRADRDYDGFGPFRFARADYEHALQRLMRELPE